ncbi:hypothetical protein RB595_005077 [Gaeumannomyces hyphopodioides]
MSSNRLIIGGLELENPAIAMADPSFHFRRDCAIALQPIFEEFSQRNRELANAHALDDAYDRYCDGDYELTLESVDDITQPSGALDANLILHIHYPPLSTTEPPNTLIHEEWNPTVNLLGRCGFDGANAFWVDTCLRRC